MISQAILEHDKRIGFPRHQDNLRVQEKQDAKLAILLSNTDRVLGGVTAMKWIGGISGFALTVLGIVVAIIKLK